MSTVVTGPKRILVVRPDTYGDLILTIPLLRTIREQLPEADTVLLIRATFADVAPFMPEGVRVLLTKINPYVGIRPAQDPDLLELAAILAELKPDCVIAPGFNGTWLERWVATQTMSARRICVAGQPLDPLTILAATMAGHAPWNDAELFPEQVQVKRESLDGAKNAAIARHLFGGVPVGGTPQITLSDPQRAGAADLLESRQLVPREFLVCCPAGVANVPIKAWPAGKFAACIARAERELGLPTLVLGHEREAGLVNEVIEKATALGAKPQSWLGRDGSFGQLVSLLASGRAYFGNDTGAMHVAAAAGVPTVGIFGGGTWPRFAPTGPAPTAAVVQPLGCFGCDWKCIFGNAPCLQTIPETTVFEALTNVLASSEAALEIHVVGPADGLDEQARALMQSAADARRHETLLTSSSGLARQLLASESDRGARLLVIEEQARKLDKTQAELNLRTAELEDLRGHFIASEEDRAARLRFIHEQGARLGELQSQLTLRSAELTDLRGQLQSGIEQLRSEVAVATAQRTVLEQQTARLKQLEWERADASKSFVRLKINLRSAVRRHVSRWRNRWGMGS